VREREREIYATTTTFVDQNDFFVDERRRTLLFFE